MIFGDTAMQWRGLVVAAYCNIWQKKSSLAHVYPSSERKDLFGVFHENEEMWEKRSQRTLLPLPTEARLPGKG